MITEKRLKEILEYSKETGIFVWKKTKGKRAVKGNIAGSIKDNGYRVIGIDKKEYREHRLAWLYEYGYMPKEIDHKDRNKSNNKIDNLRDATRAENMKNLPKRKDNKSGVTGIYKNNKKWRVLISNNGKRVYVGDFESMNEAKKARREAMKKYEYDKTHGE